MSLETEIRLDGSINALWGSKFSFSFLCKLFLRRPIRYVLGSRWKRVRVIRVALAVVFVLVCRIACRVCDCVCVIERILSSDIVWLYSPKTPQAMESRQSDIFSIANVWLLYAWSRENVKLWYCVIVLSKDSASYGVTPALPMTLSWLERRSEFVMSKS